LKAQDPSGAWSEGLSGEPVRGGDSSRRRANSQVVG